MNDHLPIRNDTCGISDSRPPGGPAVPRTIRIGVSWAPQLGHVFGLFHFADAEFVDHYNRHRPHRSLGQAAR